MTSYSGSYSKPAGPGSRLGVLSGRKEALKKRLEAAKQRRKGLKRKSYSSSTSKSTPSY